MKTNLLRILIIIITCLLALGFTAPTKTSAQGDVGYKDFGYGTAVAPTADKPQSKLWYHDGTWWGVLYNSTPAIKQHQIYRFSWANQSWTSMNVAVEGRLRVTYDVLSDGDNLYIASAADILGSETDTNIYIRSFIYNPTLKTYSPVNNNTRQITSNALEAVVIDKDTTGRLWLTYTDTDLNLNKNVFITHTSGDTPNWVTPYVLPVTPGAADNLNNDDISTLVAYTEPGAPPTPKIGVMWSNQTNNTVYFASHIDGNDGQMWTFVPALTGPSYADDHLNIKSLQADSAGQVFAVVKTSLNAVGSPNPGNPLLLLLTLDNSGSWSRRTVSQVKDNHTRPILLIDEQNRQVYVFYTMIIGTQTTGHIYYKQASLDVPGTQFPDGPGTPFIALANDTHINNASSTKQILNGTMDLLVIASDDTEKSYYHNVIDLAPSSTQYKVLLPLIMR